MKILLLCHAFNSLTQRLFVELNERQHDVSVEFDINDTISEQAVKLFQPDLIIAPFLKRAIPESIWQSHTCLIVHPGIIGDRGPSALDWAILNDVDEWGVTVLQANSEMDAGDIWASVNFPMRKTSKASLYRNEVTEAAVQAVLLSIKHFNDPSFKPLPLSDAITNGQARGQWQAVMPQSERQIDWQNDSTEQVLRKIRCADGFPGVADIHFGKELWLYNAHPAPNLHGTAGTIIGKTEQAICVATCDSAVWIGHLKDKDSDHPFKLPATQVVGDLCKDVTLLDTDIPETIRFEIIDDIGYLHFSFYNGSMSIRACLELLEAIKQAKQQPVKLLVLMGGEDYWSNGMDLNQIEAADSAADESWNNINAIDDLALEIITSTDHYLISMLQGNAGAGGVFLARAADELWARKGVILNPHYKDMGNLYGSEYWSYQLPQFVADEDVERITQSRLPMGTREAHELGLVDTIIDCPRAELQQQIHQQALALLDQGQIEHLIQQKQQRRQQDESNRTLSDYRQQELDAMHRNFYGFDPSYHVARYNFVYKIPKSRTPLTIAKHRRTSDILRRAS